MKNSVIKKIIYILIIFLSLCTMGVSDHPPKSNLGFWKKKPAIIDVSITPFPYRKASIDELKDNVNIIVTMDDPEGNVEKIEVFVTIFGLTDVLLIDATKSSACENPVSCFYAHNFSENGSKAVKGEMVFSGKNDSGFDVYKKTLPLTSIKFFGSGAVNKFKYEFEIFYSGGKKIKKNITIETSLTDTVYKLINPAIGALVGEKPLFSWRIVSSGPRLNYETKVFICRNSELKQKFLGVLFGGCYIISLGESFSKNLKEDETPKLRKGKWWWGIKEIGRMDARNQVSETNFFMVDDKISLTESEDFKNQEDTIDEPRPAEPAQEQPELQVIVSPREGYQGDTFTVNVYGMESNAELYFSLLSESNNSEIINLQNVSSNELGESTFAFDSNPEIMPPGNYIVEVSSIVNGIDTFGRITITLREKTPPNEETTSTECDGQPASQFFTNMAAEVSPGPASKLRSGPGLGYDVIDRIEAGNTFTIVDGPVCSDGYRWWKIRLPNGYEGWMADGDGNDRWIIPDDGNSNQSGSDIYYPVSGCAASRIHSGDKVELTPGTDYVSIRSEPDTHPADNKIGKIYENEVAIVTGNPVCNYGWLLWPVQKEDGTSGWAPETDGSEFWLETTSDSFNSNQSYDNGQNNSNNNSTIVRIGDYSDGHIDICVSGNGGEYLEEEKTCGQLQGIIFGEPFIASDNGMRYYPIQNPSSFGLGCPNPVLHEDYVNACGF